MLLSKNAQTNSSEPESSRVVTDLKTESEEQSESPWFIQGPELNSETESEQMLQKITHLKRIRN